LPDRVEDYEREWLDALGNAGKVVWQRRTLPAPSGGAPVPSGAAVQNGTVANGVALDTAPEGVAPDGAARSGPWEKRAPGKAGPVRATPIALVRRGHLGLWRRLGGADDEAVARLSASARAVLGFLEREGASFVDDIARGTALLHTQLETALAELASLGLVYSDSFLGLRALLLPAEKRKPIAGGRRRRTADYGLEDAGRWVATTTAAASASAQDASAPATGGPTTNPTPLAPAADDLDAIAWLLLRRWGVVFRRVLDREGALPPWRDLLRALRRLEARGEIRGGRFVAGWSGEQFALPEAVSALRRHRQAPDRDQWIAVSATDPLNLIGILTPGARVPAVSTNRVLYRNGRAAAVLAGRDLVALEPLVEAELWEARKLLERRAPAARAALAV
jgi:ATP-dependent Lhr-like helicase